MFRLTIHILITWVLVITNVHAETYIREYTYSASEADSKITSRAIALDQVKSILLQEIGTHIRQTVNITKDGSGNTFASEDVEAITAGLTKVDILEEKWDGTTYYLKAEIESDTERVLNALEEFKKVNSKENRKQLTLLKENERSLNISRIEIDRLKKELRLEKSKSSNSKLLADYKNELNNLSSIEMINKGFNFYDKKQYDDALYWMLKSAELDNSSAQNHLGWMYQYGEGVKQDYKKAVYWFNEAIENGNVAALNNQGWMYHFGHGVKKDGKKAFSLMREAAELNGSVSQHNLGWMYQFGINTKEDNKLAFYWYVKSAEQGHTKAMVDLGHMYKNGLGIPRDAKRAFNWYKKAGKLGDADAAFILSGVYEYGRGVEIDDIKAEYWLISAAEGGKPIAQYYLGRNYEHGFGIEQDYTLAFYWYSKGADQGNHGAQDSLGDMYKDGIGIEQDIAKSNYWYNKAAEQGYYGGKTHDGKPMKRIKNKYVRIGSKEITE